MTRNQYLRQMKALEAKMGPDKSRVHHQFDNGWAVTQPMSRRDIGRTGTLMRNCWRHGFAGGGDPYVLRDPDGIPRTVWNVKAPHMAGHPVLHMDPTIDPSYYDKVDPRIPRIAPGQQVIDHGAHRPLGHANSEPSPEHWGMIQEWAKAQSPPMLQWKSGAVLGEPGPVSQARDDHEPVVARRAPNAVHGAPEGLTEHQDDLGRTAAGPIEDWESEGGAPQGGPTRHANPGG